MIFVQSFSRMTLMGKDNDYLGKLQDYYATHKVMPSYQAIADLLGFKSKNAVAALVARLKLLGFIESAPDKRLKPGSRFFERVLAESTVQAGLPTAALSDNSDSLSIDEYLIENPSRTVLITVKGDSMMDAGIVQDDVVIYAGATVLGRVTIGQGASIGGNVWVTHDVAPGAQGGPAQEARRGVPAPAAAADV